MIFNSPERVAALTPLWTGERLPDGRPSVPDDILERMKLVTNDEAWGVLETRTRLPLPVRGELDQSAPGSRPRRPRRHRTHGAATPRLAGGRPGHRRRRGAQRRPEHLGDRHACSKTTSWWSISSARSTTAPSSATTWARPSRARAGTGHRRRRRHPRSGARLPARRFQRLLPRASHPTAIADVTLVGVNVPIRIGHATVLPGDVVLGTARGSPSCRRTWRRSVVERSEDVRQRDVFGKQPPRRADLHLRPDRRPGLGRGDRSRLRRLVRRAGSVRVAAAVGIRTAGHGRLRN